MPRIKDEQLAEARREQILEAAARVFRRKGFHAARTEEICAEAGLSPGTLFRHFKDKDAIIATIVEHETRTYLEQVEQAFTPEGLERLLNLGGKGLAELLAPTRFDVSTESWLELSRNPKLRELTSNADRKFEGAVAAAIARAQARRQIRKSLNPDTAATLLISLFSGLMSDHEINPHQDLEGLALQLRDLLRRYLTDPPKPRSKRG